MKTLNTVALILIVIGGINWLLWGVFEFNLVAALFGTLSWFSRLIYVAVGLAAIYTLFVIPQLTRNGATHHRVPPARV